MPAAITASFVVHADRPIGELSPLWFGHNLEHTRSCIWRGLSAQLLRNRKFAGNPEQLTGQAMGWYAIGADDGLFLLDDEGSYTRHSDRTWRQRWNEARCQHVHGPTEGVRYGLGQGSLPIQEGVLYESRFVLRAAEPIEASLRLLSHDGATTYAATKLAVAPGEWRTCRADLAAPCNDPAARLELSFTGPGELVVGCASLLPACSPLGMRTDVVELLREIGTPLLRWPGGNFAGDYRWQDGLLEVDQRAPLQAFLQMETLPHTGGYDMHEVGTDEYIALCQELGAEPFISINLAWDSPEDAAAWVEYCNGAPTTEWGRLRAERGHPEPYAVKYWSLGNELGYQHMEGPNNPAEYARRAREIGEAMRRADPAIVLVSSGAWWEDAWFSDCLAPMQDVVDHISHHWYQRNLVRDFGGDGFRAQYEAMMTAPHEWLTQMKAVRARIEACVAEDRFIGIAFDEWNTWYAWYRTPGVAEGMYAAAMLDAFCHHAAEVGMTFGCYFEPVNEGAIVVQPYGARLTAIGQVQALYRAHHGNTAVEVRPDPADTPVLLTASVAGDGRLVLVLVNVSPDAAAQVEVDLAGEVGRCLEEGLVLRAEGCLPGSVFVADQADARLTEGRALSVGVPPMSLVRITMAQDTHAC